MSNKWIEMRKIKRLYNLHTQGISLRQISIQLGVSRTTIKKYIEFFTTYQLSNEEVESLTIEELSQLFYKQGKPKSERLKTLEQYFPYFDKELRRTGVTRLLLWQEYITKHPDGLKLSQFNYWYREWCLAVSPVMHFNHKAGDKLFIDYTGKKLYLVDEHSGELKAVEVFVCVLGSSQMTYAQASHTQQKEDFILAIENALWFYGGVPRALVTDNLKAAVKKSSKYEPILNETFADFAEYYQTSILPTRAYRPRDKAIVENSVRIIYTRVFAKLRNKTFHSIDKLNEEIKILLEAHNNTSFRGRTYSRKLLFEQTDSPALMPLPQNRYELKQYTNGTVHKNSHVYLSKDKHYYSVPFKYIGNKARIIYSRSLVQIYVKQKYVAEHVRNQQPYTYITNKEHMPSHHRFVSEWSSDKFIKWAAYIGENCRIYIIKILDKKQHPEQSYKSCAGILHMAKKVGNKRLDNACKRALEYKAYNYKTIQKILEKGWDNILDIEENKTDIPQHINIRGRDYYK